MKKVIYGLITIFLIVLCIFLYSWYRLHQSLILPHIPSKETPKTYNLHYQTRTFTGANGKKLEGWYIPADNAKAVVIVVHGYARSKGSMVNQSAYLYKAGYSTFVIDLSSDAPHAKTMLGTQEYKDILGAYDYMRSLPENANKKIGVLSASMGAASTLVAASKTGKGDFIIASVPYANFESLFSKRLEFEKLPLPLLPFILLASAFEVGFDYKDFAPDAHVKNIRKPILFFSAKNDTRVNSNDAKTLYDLANKPKYYWQAQNSNHDIYTYQPKEFEKHVLEFLSIVD